MQEQRYNFLDSCSQCAFIGRSGEYDIHRCANSGSYFVVSSHGEEAASSKEGLENSTWKSVIEFVTGDDDPSVSPNARASA